MAPRRPLATIAPRLAAPSITGDDPPVILLNTAAKIDAMPCSEIRSIWERHGPPAGYAFPEPRPEDLSALVVAFGLDPAATLDDLVNLIGFFNVSSAVAITRNGLPPALTRRVAERYLARLPEAWGGGSGPCYESLGSTIFRNSPLSEIGEMIAQVGTMAIYALIGLLILGAGLARLVKGTPE